MPDRLLWITFFKGGLHHNAFFQTCFGTYCSPSRHAACLSSGKNLSEADTVEADLLDAPFNSQASVFPAVYCVIFFKFPQSLFCHLCFLWHCFFTTILWRISLWKSGSIFFAVCAVFACINSFSRQLMPLLLQIRPFPFKLCGFIPKPVFYTI